MNIVMYNIESHSLTITSTTWLNNVPHWYTNCKCTDKKALDEVQWGILKVAYALRAFFYFFIILHVLHFSFLDLTFFLFNFNPPRSTSSVLFVHSDATQSSFCFTTTPIPLISQIPHFFLHAFHLFDTAMFLRMFFFFYIVVSCDSFTICFTPLTRD